MHEVTIENVGALSNDDLTERLLGELDQIARQDRIVQEIFWGDEELTGPWEEFLARPRQAGQGPLVIRSVAAAELLEETVNDAVTHLGHLDGQVEQVVHHLRCGADDEAMTSLPGLLEGLQSIAPLLEVLGSRALLPAPEAEERIAGLGATLADLMRAWQQENLVEMADLLKFGLRSLLAQIHDSLSALSIDRTVARMSSRI